MIEAQMKKVSSVIAIVAAAFSYFSLSSFAYAQSICPPKGSQFENLCDLKLDKSGDLVGRIVTILLIVAVILSLIFLIWGAIRWITSGGDKGKLDGARQAILAAIVGLILAFLAYAILNIVLLIFTGKAATTFTIPTLVP